MNNIEEFQRLQRSYEAEQMQLREQIKHSFKESQSNLARDLAAVERQLNEVESKVNKVRGKATETDHGLRATQKQLAAFEQAFAAHQKDLQRELDSRLSLSRFEQVQEQTEADILKLQTEFDETTVLLKSAEFFIEKYQPIRTHI